MHICSWKKIDKILTHFGDVLCKKWILFIASGVQIDNGVHPPRDFSKE